MYRKLARSIIAESLVNNRYNDKFKAYSAGSNPKINKDIKHFLNNKGFNFKITHPKILMFLLMEKSKLIMLFYVIMQIMKYVL